MPSANLFLIGAPKAGTTSLAWWLSEHPQVFWSVPKEPFFWADDYPRMRALYGFATRTSYDRLYRSREAAGAVWRGDGSTTYLYSQTAVPNILAAVPDAKFILCVRDSVELLPSYHRTQLTALNETETDFEKAWRRSLEGGTPPGDPLDHKLVDYPLVGCLGAATARVADQIPAGNLEIVQFPDLRAAPYDTYCRVLAFLGLSDNPDSELPAKNASDHAARFPGLRMLTHRPPQTLGPMMTRVRQWSRTTRMPGIQEVKRSMWRPEPRPRISSELRKELVEYFAADARLLGSVLDGKRDS